MDHKFLIVCGLPRSGTRQFADYLNFFDSVNIQGEISERLINDLSGLVAQADSIYLSSKYKQFWLDKRPMFIYECFKGLQKGRIENNEFGELIGFKTPYIEGFHEELRGILYPSFESLNWFFCVRNFIDCYRSLLSMPWFNRTADSFVYKYVKSLNDICRIYQTRIDAREKVRILNLSSYVKSEDKPAWLRERLLLKAGLDSVVAESERAVKSVGNRNSGENRFGVKESFSIPQSDMDVFAMKKDAINESIERFNDVFGEDLVFVGS